MFPIHSLIIQSVKPYPVIFCSKRRSVAFSPLRVSQQPLMVSRRFFLLEVDNAYITRKKKENVFRMKCIIHTRVLVSNRTLFTRNNIRYLINSYTEKKQKVVILNMHGMHTGIYIRKISKCV